MTVRRIRILLWAAGLLLWCGVPALWAWCLLAPTAAPVADDPLPKITAAQTPSPRIDSAAAPSLADFASWWNRPLRADWTAVAVASTRSVAPTRPKPPLTVKLLGLFYEQGRSKALFSSGAGRLEIKGEGEQLDEPNGPKIVKIEPHQVRLLHHGESVTLELSPLVDFISAP